MNPFEKLSRGYVITAGGRLVMGIGRNTFGAIASVLSDEVSGQAFLDRFRSQIELLNLGVPILEPVGDPWKLMHRAAGEGLAGIECANTQIFPERFIFMVRVEEAGFPLPTVLTSLDETGWGPSLTRTGVRQIEHAELLHWSRFDILDRVSGIYGQRCPFRGWNHGDPLFELRNERTSLQIANVPILGDWISIDGAFAFFTDQECAEHYLAHYLERERYRLIFSPESQIGNGYIKEPLEKLVATPVVDLQQRLGELNEISPFSDWCINPIGHRENSGYGSLLGKQDANLSETGFCMKSVSGIWKISALNKFEIVTRFTSWSGTDTIGWSGGQALQLLPLDRSFATGPELVGSGVNALTESETEEITQQIFEDNDVSDLSEKMVAFDQNVVERMNLFHILCWDSVTGEGCQEPWRFANVLEALRFLAAYERSHDRQTRSEGAMTHNILGFSGSRDESAEELRSQRFQLGLSRIAQRTLRQGYRPQDAEDIVTLCNGVLRTLHLNIAGYPKDLLWASSSEQEVELLDLLGIDEAVWKKWSESVETKIDPFGKSLVISKISEEAWDTLLPNTRHFLATALLHLDLQGSAPQLDYAPISLEVVKALELELGGIFQAFRDDLGSLKPDSNSENHEEIALAKFLGGGKAPTLGACSYLLKSQPGSTSQLIWKFHQFIAAMPNAEFLMNPNFAKRGLQRAINKYRNGGAHDSPISEETCRECITTLVGSKTSPGFIPLVSSWRSPSSELNQ